MAKTDPPVLRLLILVVLSLLAGSIDAISFLGLDGLFTNHVTGNLVILAAHAVDGEAADPAKLLSDLESNIDSPARIKRPAA